MLGPRLWSVARTHRVLATVRFSDYFQYCSSKKTRPQPVRSWFVPNGSLNKVDEYTSHNLMFGIWNMQLWTAHLFVVSDFWYLQNWASCFEIIAIVGQKLGFWATACSHLNISKIGDGEKMHRAELHILRTKQWTLWSIFVAVMWWFFHKIIDFWWGKDVVTSVSNGSGQPASGPGLDRKNRSVRFQTLPKTRPADCWRAKPRPVPVNPRVSPGLARPVSSDLRFCISGFTFMVAFRYAIVNRKILTLVLHASFSTY